MPDEGAVTLEHMTAVAEGEQFDQLACDPATVRPHCITWMCTSGSFTRGLAWDAQARQILSAYGRCPATTTSTPLGRVSGLEGSKARPGNAI
jgi:maleate cis-trans isomerase